MFIMFIETAINKFPDVAIGEFVAVATCCYECQQVATNRNKVVV